MATDIYKKTSFPDSFISNQSALIPLKTEKLMISVVSSYLPRECGIATYTYDLLNSLQKQYGDSILYKIYPLDIENSKYQNTQNVENVIHPGDKEDFDVLIKNLNSSRDSNILLVQHEFGLFKEDPENLIRLLRGAKCSKFTVLHTVLPEPSIEILDTIRNIATFSDKVIVMTEKSKKILYEQYRLSSSKIAVIPHGTHNIPLKSKSILKEKYGITSKYILSTFGLLGPGKSIDTTIVALPQILENYPDLKFYILGKTHPELLKENGENYRNYLKELIDKFKLKDHVVFVDKFIKLNELIDYLQLTDLYLFTSIDPYQAVSGTFAYAVGSGCPIVSTPIPHAQAVIKSGMGELFDFRDSDQLAKKVICLLKDEEKLHQMKLNGLHYNYATIWENSALLHMNLIQDQLMEKSLVKQKLPNYNLNHLRKLTTEDGILQFSILNNPDIDSGYTLDDNARALIFSMDYFELTGDKTILPLIEIYLNYVLNSKTSKGSFYNYKDFTLTITSQNINEELYDVNGRAIWALGSILRHSNWMADLYKEQLALAKNYFYEILDTQQNCKSLRACAFMIKGIYNYQEYFPLTDVLSKYVRRFSDHLKSCYLDKSENHWNWFEDYLTYDNALLSEAMLLAGTMLKDSHKTDIAKESIQFLISITFKNDFMTLIKNKDWFHKGNQTESRGGEQPIDATSMILALEKFNRICPSKQYRSTMETGFDWFMGKNRLTQHVYDHKSGGCHDGIEDTNINLNQGAESTLSYLLARNVMERRKRSKAQAHLIKTSNHLA